jgi:hypothetical protein
MFLRFVAFLTALAVAPVAAAEYRTASELLDAMLDAQQKRAEGVSNYAMDVTLMDQPSTQFYERTEIEIQGRRFQSFRLVPLHEVQQRIGGNAGTPSVDVGSYAGGRGGLPSGLARQAADVDHTAVIAERAEIVGEESIDGRNAYLVKADDLSLEQAADGGEYVIRSIALWVDTRDLVMLKMRMDGVMKQDGQVREMYFEKLDQDFRDVPGSSMILPYRSVLSMGGMLGPKEQKEMEEARAQLAEFDQQMASMPADQKAMMQSMMGSKIEMMRKMVESGTFEVETIVSEIRINPGISDAFANAPKAAGGSGAVPAMAGFGDLIRHAQTGMAQPKQDGQSLQQAREACLQRKIDEAQAKKKKKKRFGKFLGAVGRIAGRHATGGLATDVSRVSTSVYEAGATARDLKDAAEALGISEDDIAACENPR